MWQTDKYMVVFQTERHKRDIVLGQGTIEECQKILDHAFDVELLSEIRVRVYQVKELEYSVIKKTKSCIRKGDK